MQVEPLLPQGLASPERAEVEFEKRNLRCSLRFFHAFVASFSESNMIHIGVGNGASWYGPDLPSIQLNNQSASRLENFGYMREHVLSFLRTTLVAKSPPAYADTL